MDFSVVQSLPSTANGVIGSLCNTRDLRQSVNPVPWQGKRNIKFPLLTIRNGLHPDWRQVDNKIRRLHLRIGDFRLLSNDIRLQRSKIGSDDSEIDQNRLLESIKKKEEQVLAERDAIQKEMEHLTVYFHKGADFEYRSLRRFFLSYLYHTTRNAFQHLPVTEFDRFLLENPNGVSFDLSEWGTVSLSPYLCKKVFIGKKISVSASGLDTTPLAIALAIVKAGSQKHCNNPTCRKEECNVPKADYEELFEAVFKRKIRPLINQKARGEMHFRYDAYLKIQRSSEVKVR